MPRGDARSMAAEIFTIVGLIAISLLGLARWWEEN
jgi:hypothetical protein